MITRIEIDGFKSFLDFKLDVPPFLALVGPNASGKSNLFDALRLVADVVEYGWTRPCEARPAGEQGTSSTGRPTAVRLTGSPSWSAWSSPLPPGRWGCVAGCASR